MIILTAYSKSGEEIARYIPVNIKVIPQLKTFFSFFDQKSVSHTLQNVCHNVVTCLLACFFSMIL